MFLDRHGHFFRTRTRHNVAVARRYLRGLAQAEDCTFESMAAVVEGGCPQQFQHFISCSPWDHEPVVAQIGQDADRLLGGKPTSALIIDESSFPKQGDRSVGVARQWTGRLGKIDNCQVAVFGVLTDGERHTPIDARLYLPERWIEDPARCERAGIPEAAREKMSKSELALDIVRRARARGIRFAWVGVDGGYGKEPDFLRRLDDENETFVADVHRNQHIWTKEPGLHVPASKPGRGRPSKKQKPATASITVEKLAEGIPPEDWTRYWVERAFEDAKGECGLADYQALGWRPWHHHVTMVMLAMLFIVEQRVAQQPGLELLTPRDIVEMLKETLPRKPEGREALVARINERHARRRGAIESRFRNQHKRDSG